MTDALANEFDGDVAPRDLTARDRTVSEGSTHSESDAEPHFEPIVTLPEVRVVADEHEELLLQVRAKLYRFDTSGDEGPEWKERGTGEVKFLQNRDNNSVRIVMRRDKTFKVCANHFITPTMELKPSTGSDKAFVYTVVGDYADETIKSECLAIKFGTTEQANLFRDKFNECKDLVLRQCSLYNDEGDREVTQKLKDLDVSKDVENNR